MKHELRSLWAPLAAAALCTATAHAAVAPMREPALAARSFRQPQLFVPEVNEPLTVLPALAAGLRRELADLGVAPEQAFYDSRSGRWSSLILSQPLVPGTGHGNTVRWEDLGASKPLDGSQLQHHAWNALRGFLLAHQGQLRVDPSELAGPSVGVFEGGTLIQIHAPRVVGGVPVRDSGLTAIVNHGNLVLLGLQNWADVAPLSAGISFEAARARVRQHVSPLLVTDVGRGRLELIPTLRDNAHDFRLVWVVPASVSGDMGSWEGLVDAVSGDLLAFEDTNQYASRRMVGGVYPVSNDQRPTDGMEQAGWPMPFADVVIGPNTMFTNSGGSLGCSTGSGTTTLSGLFVRVNDTCGAVSETSAGDFDLGFGPLPTDTDCTVPPGHSAGDTKSSRTAFYHLNRIIEQARGYLPANGWLMAPLTSNVNVNASCGASWSGSTVNYLRSNPAAGCRNPGEIASVLDHEWGHGLDDNGVNGSISNPAEGIADIRATLRLNNSCVGRGLLPNAVCAGYGDPCTGTPATGCTGVRDADFALHVSGLPHDIAWIRTRCGSGSGPCGRETHCEGQGMSEVAWDLQFRDLRSAPFSLDPDTALELATRLFYLGAETVTGWYTCTAGCETAGTCGCGATGGYLLTLAADDDNGNLGDGTPHMQAINGAFNRHQMACNVPAVVNAGCAAGPTTAPTVTATAGIDSVSLGWTAVPNASRYFVYRTEGASACAFGKVKVGDVTATSFTDTGLLSGRPYSYMVLPVGSNPACFGRGSSCASATPTPAACAADAVEPQALSVDAGGNGVLQPNEPAVAVAPTWRNTGTNPIALTGALSAFTGPAGPTYTIDDPSAEYGTIPVSTSQPCTSCYAVSVTSTSRPIQHWDATALETVTPTASTKNWTLHVGDSFTDVPAGNGFYRFVEILLHKGVTSGCGGTSYCPSDSTTREQMAVFVLIAKEGAGYNPPACAPPNVFNDVPETSPFCRFIEELSVRGVVSGCGGNNYCPQDPVTREQMAIFTLRTVDPTLNPPACATPMFNDVPASSPFCRWIEELARRGVVSGCGGNNYCPKEPVSRQQMGVFLSVTFGLTLYGL